MQPNIKIYHIPTLHGKNFKGFFPMLKCGKSAVFNGQKTNQNSIKNQLKVVQRNRGIIVNMLATIILCILLIRCNNPHKDSKESTQKVLVIEKDTIVNKLFLSEKNFDSVLSDLQEVKRSEEIRANKHNSNQNDTVVSLYQSNDSVVYVIADGKEILKDLNLSNPNAGFGKVKIGMSKENFSNQIGKQNVPDLVLISGQEGLNDFKVIFSNDTLVKISYDLEYLD